MSNFKIISDGSCDLSEAQIKEINIEIVPFYVTFDETNYLRENVDITKEDYFKRLTTEATFPKTSQPSPEDYFNVYKPHLEAGDSIVVLTISSVLSGSYQSATIAAGMAKDDFPDCKIFVVDSQSASYGQALILFELVNARDSGASAEEAAEKANVLKKDTKLFFTLETLEFLQRGGRLSKASALLGGMLNLKPILTLTDGAIVPVTKVRSKKKALATIMENLSEWVGNDKDNYEYMTVNINVPEEGRIFQEQLEAEFGIKFKYPSVNAGVTIGTHIGPGGMGVACMKKG